MNVEIIAIGNELLIGKIQDTNSLWIIQQLLPLGIKVNRITVIPDEVTIIADTIRSTILRNPSYIFTSGGLGPTFDDMTLDGIAKGLIPSQPLEENIEAIEMIRQEYIKRYANVPGKDASLTSQRRKMGILPRGAKALKNREGTAPGVYINCVEPHQNTKIICLPGVPKELKGLFLDHILPELLQLTKNNHFYEAGLIFQDIGESAFSEFVNNIKDQYPLIWIKTHPRKKEHMEVELHLTTFSDKDEVKTQMKELYHRLHEYVLQSKGKIIKETPLN